jgi:hypothetical protein
MSRCACCAVIAHLLCGGRPAARLLRDDHLMSRASGTQKKTGLLPGIEPVPAQNKFAVCGQALTIMFGKQEFHDFVDLCSASNSPAIRCSYSASRFSRFLTPPTLAATHECHRLVATSPPAGGAEQPASPDPGRCDPLRSSLRSGKYHLFSEPSCFVSHGLEIQVVKAEYPLQVRREQPRIESIAGNKR